MPKIFNEDEWTDDARNVSADFVTLVQPWFELKIAEGFSIRELSLLCIGDIQQIESCCALDKRSSRIKKKN